MNPRALRRAAAALLLLAAAAPGCAVLGRGATDPDLVDGRSGGAGSRERMYDDVASVPMVFVGESHTHPGHHAEQLRILRAVRERRRGPVLLGMEMFERPFQPVLDDWSRGALSEPEFLRRSGWFEKWGTDWALYRDLLLYARDNGIRVVALNAERAVVSAIGRQGLDGIPPWMRAKIPQDIDTTDEAHRRSIREVTAAHPGMALTDERFERFYAAQVTWDETMAESAVLALREAGPDACIVVLAGGMHVQGFHAIPERARRRNGLDYRTVLPMERDRVPEEGIARGAERPADWVVLTAPLVEAPPARLGLSLVGGSAEVKLVLPGSAAAAAGLREGDVLLSVGGTPIADGTDLRLAVDGARVGDRVAVRYRRDGADSSVEAVLAAPAPPPAVRP
jgi:aminopeptidase N